MSAIFGIVYPTEVVVQPDKTAAMKQVLIHRATDGMQTVVLGNVMMGHARLINTMAAQNEVLPLTRGALTITADARIDNRDEVIKKLGLGHNTMGDGELILETFKRWGEACVDHLDGEFTFAIWNSERQELYVASDHMGLRTCYYEANDEYFVFASEIKAIRACHPQNRRFNKFILADWFANAHTENTFDQDIRILPAATKLKINGKLQLNKTKYWYLQARGKYRFAHNDDWAECVNELVYKAMAARLSTPHPVGIALSGGLDSSYFAAVAAKILQRQNKTLFAFSSLTHPDAASVYSDEGHYINLMAKRYENIQLVDVCPPDKVLPIAIDSPYYFKTERINYPFIYIDEALCKAAKDYDVRTMLSGFAGDFAISNNGVSAAYDLCVAGRYKQAMRCLTTLQHLEGVNTLVAFKRFILDFTALNSLYKPVIDILKNKKQHEFNFRYFKTYPFEKEIVAYMQQVLKVKDREVSGYQTYFDLVNGLGMGPLLFNVHKNLAAWYNTETTAPFMNKSISEFFADLPQEQLLVGGQRRSLIRRTMQQIVPTEIVNRKDKMNFSPDFKWRYLKQLEVAKHLLTSADYAAADQYLDRQFIADKFLTTINQDPQPTAIDREIVLLCNFILFANKASRL